jgi:hypothetical protein
MTQISLNGNQYSDDGTAGHDMRTGGFRTHLLPMLGDAMTDAATKVAAAATQVALAKAQADSAAASALTALNAPGTMAISATQVQIGMGLKTFMIQPAKNIGIGMTMKATSAGNTDNYMQGDVTAYNAATGELTIKVSIVGGGGKFSDWSINQAAIGGASLGKNTFIDKQTMNGAAFDQAAGAPIASAGIVNLAAATGNYIHITGSAGPITAFTLAEGAERTVVFDGTPTITHNAASLILPGGKSIPAEIGDMMILRGEPAGVRCVDYVRANGLPVVSPQVAQSLTLLLTTTISTPVPVLNFLSVFSALYDNYLIIADGLSFSVSDYLCLRFANAGVVDTAANFTNNSAGGITNINLGSAYLGGKGFTGSFTVFNANDPALLKNLQYQYASNPSAGTYAAGVAAFAYTGAAVSGFTFYAGNGNNFASGTIKIFGYRNS